MSQSKLNFQKKNNNNYKTNNNYINNTTTLHTPTRITVPHIAKRRYTHDIAIDVHHRCRRQLTCFDIYVRRKTSEY